MKKNILFFVLLLLFSCKKTEIPPLGIYVWDSRMSYNYFSTEESQAIFDNQIKKIYCKLTDIVWDAQIHAKPGEINELPFDNPMAQYAQIVPCFYITNEVMLKSTREELAYMAKKIAARLATMKIHEVQFDCDWSEKSKENYFFFLKTTRRVLNDDIKISATIRLYQYRYPEKTGVPPVDRGMLMLYNFTSPQKYNGKNPIFEENEAKKYLNGEKYSLPLDFAIPSYDWKVLYDRDSTFLGFLDSQEFEDLKQFSFQKNDSNIQIIRKDTSIANYFVRSGQIMINYPSPSPKKPLELVKKLANTDNYTITLFSLNSATTTYLLSDENIFKNSKH